MLRAPFSQELIPINNWDVIVVGAGAAGLMTCLELPASLKVLLLNRNTSKVSSSRWAQGGIASVIRQDDSFDLHAHDTLKAGDGLCDFQAVEMLVKEAPGCVDRLQNLGMIFDQSSDQLATTLEAAHSIRRVLHVKDRTGRALVEVLEEHVENKELEVETSLEENVVTKGAKPAERSDLKNEAEDIGGPDVKTAKPDDKESIGKKVAAKMKKAAAPSTKPSDASGKVAEETTEVEGENLAEEETSVSEYSFDEDLDALVSGSELTEEFRDKAKLIFEAAVAEKVNAEVATISEAYEKAYEESVAELKTELSEQIDSYLTFVAQKWVEENALAIDNGIKAEIAENVMRGLQNLFIENNLDVPEEKFDLVDNMVEKLDEMENKLNEQIEINVEMHKKLGGYIKNGIVSEVSVGLAETQKDKLQGLSEGVEFKTEEDFRNKIETIKESYFTRKAEVAEEAKEPTEEASQPLVESTVSGTMGKYVDALARWSK